MRQWNKRADLCVRIEQAHNSISAQFKINLTYVFAWFGFHIYFLYGRNDLLFLCHRKRIF